MGGKYTRAGSTGAGLGGRFRVIRSTTIVTTVGVIFAIYQGIRAQQAETRNALAAASRTEAAAALTQDSTPQLVDALQEIVQRASQVGAPVTVRWSLRNFDNDRYVLENIGARTARQVRVSSHESLELLDLPRPQDVGPGESVTFMAAPSLATSDRTVTVTWADDGEDKSWRYPLPPRPKQRRVALDDGIPMSSAE